MQGLKKYCIRFYFYFIYSSIFLEKHHLTTSFQCTNKEIRIAFMNKVSSAIL